MLNLVIARARTRGKSPVEFTYKGIGRLVTRKVTDKDGNPIILSKNDKGEEVQVKYSYDKDGKLTSDNPALTQAEDKSLVLGAGLRYVEVDDFDTKSATENFQEVLDLFGTLSEDERGKRTPLQMAIDSSLDGFNYLSRKTASPVSEQVTEDELQPLVNALIAAKVLTEEDSTIWRRAMTTAAKVMEQDRLEFAKTSPAFRKLPADVQAQFKTAA